MDGAGSAFSSGMMMRLPCEQIRSLDTQYEDFYMHPPQCEGVRALLAVLCLLRSLSGGNNLPALTVFGGSLPGAWPVPRLAPHSRLWRRTLQPLPSRECQCGESRLSDGTALEQLGWVGWIYRSRSIVKCGSIVVISDDQTLVTNSFVTCEKVWNLQVPSEGTSENFGQSVCLMIPPSDNTQLKSNLQ